MKRQKETLIVALFFIVGNAYAENSVEVAMGKLDTDLAKLKIDLTANKEKPVVDADKAQIKIDQSALKAARRSIKKHPWIEPSK
jgi:hypothetical protein